MGEKQWIGVECQAPAPKLEIFKPGTAKDAPDITYSAYSADPKPGIYSNFLGYAFSEAVDDLEGSFSFTVENDEVEQDGKTLFDIIPVRSVVKIYEGDLEHPAFVGIIRRRHLGVSMTSQGVKRSISFSGKSIISCITEYTVSLDVRIQGVSDAMAKNYDLETSLTRDDLAIKDFMKESWDYFKNISENAGVVTTGIAEIINRFIGDGKSDNFIEVTGKEQKLRYNVATVFFNAANNVIADIWRNILPKPVYELFSRCDGGNPKIIARRVPFGEPDDGGDWRGLALYLIRPISLIAYDLEQSDEEVYTAFASYIIGSGMSREFYMAVSQTGEDSNVKYSEKQKIYGFKPLEISFNGYDRQGNTRNEKTGGLTVAIRELNELASYWYSRLDDMYSGTITVCTDFNNPETNPRAGCRAQFMGGEFYIERTDHAWNFGGTPTIRLSVSRGMIYADGGQMKDGEAGIINNVGRRFRELEEANS